MSPAAPYGARAMDSTLQDILIRFAMQGYAALWVPAPTMPASPPDQGGEELRKNEGLTRYDLGRDKFLERVWTGKPNTAGASLSSKRNWEPRDWSWARFTMDDGLSAAVRHVFVTPITRASFIRAAASSTGVPTVPPPCPRRRGGNTRRSPATSGISSTHPGEEGRWSWWPPPVRRLCWATPAWP